MLAALLEANSRLGALVRLSIDWAMHAAEKTILC